MILEFVGKIIYWRGPSPWFYVVVPPEESDAIKAISNSVTYGWGVIPVTVTIGETQFTTSLFPRDGLYLVPLKVIVRKAESLELDADVLVKLVIAD
jgi:hypothetical protein